ncbi:hypothetical protein MYX76_02745 [Desulfobacterota bacterium AH_259_B03_O07]|nr:hypothetical protein [Desulfobacterota bacterium AH_259_B03_O07]
MKLRNWTKWILFVTILITVPVPYYMVVIGGLIPSIGIIYLAIQGLSVALPKFTSEGFWMLGILWAHVIVIGTVLFIISAGINWLFFRIFSMRYAFMAVAALIIVLLISSTFEIYRLPGHNSSPPANIFKILKKM